MAFRLREEARSWFKDLREQDFSTDFDSYYFCFIAGIASKTKKDTAQAETAELIDYFPDRYRDRAQLLIALFIAAELEYLGITIAEKKTVHAAISRLVNPNAPSHLSDEGLREFNKYAHGGFDVLRDWYEDRPRRLITFLRIFKGRIDQLLPSAG